MASFPLADPGVMAQKRRYVVEFGIIPGLRIETGGTLS
jgi:hypothetical protein